MVLSEGGSLIKKYKKGSPEGKQSQRTKEEESVLGREGGPDFTESMRRDICCFFQCKIS